MMSSADSPTEAICYLVSCYLPRLYFGLGKFTTVFSAVLNSVRPFLMTGLRTDTVFEFLVCSLCIFYFFLVSSL